MTDKIRTCDGAYEGRVALEPKRNAGFGYDPIFYFPPLGKTTAEMSLEEKNEHSHRGKATRTARDILASDFLVE